MKSMLIAVLAIASIQMRLDALSVTGLSQTLSKLGRNFGRATGKLDALESIASVTGYGAVGLEGYWKSNTIAAFSQLKRGEVEEAMETFNLAIATLAVWDVGKGIALPIVDKLINKIVLKYKHDFRNTISAFDNLKDLMKTGVLDTATALPTPDALKGKLLDAKGQISAAFETDVKAGMSRFKNTQIYGDLVTDLKGVKTWAKAAKWADVLAGPLFDAATVAVSAWQLAEAIKSKDAFGIASNSLGLASGIVGIASFAVAALATAGTTLAAVAGPIGAIVGAVLCIASVIVDIIASLNPYKRIDRDISVIKELTVNSKKLLDVDQEKLNQMVPEEAKFAFSWVYEMNQGLALEYIRGRADEYYVPVTFRMDEGSEEEDDYLVVGENKKFDKGKYPGNLFWNPQGLVDIGYDFYGKKLSNEFDGATVIAGTELVAGKPDVVLKGLDIVTYKNPSDEFRDCVIIDDMYDMAEQHRVKAKTGGGNDVIVINGLIGKPGHPNYHEGYGSKINISTAADRSTETKKGEFNVLSFEGMSTKKNHDYGISGVRYNLRGGTLQYLLKPGSAKKSVTWGAVTGVKMFVGSPFNDIVEFSMDHDYIIRETKGNNEFILSTTSWGPFAITIDDQCEEPGKLTIKEGHSFAGRVTTSHLVYSSDTRTLYIYGRPRGERWKIRGTIFFNRRVEGLPIVRTEADGEEKPLNEYPSTFTAEGETDYLREPEKGVQYYFDRNLESSACSAYKIYLNTPEFQRGSYTMTFHKRKNSEDVLIMKEEFVTNCLKKAKRSLIFTKTGASFRNRWILKLKAEDGLDSTVCPGKDFEVRTDKLPFERLIEELPGGKSRVVVDICRDKRYAIDVVEEMRKLDEREAYEFNKDFQGNSGVPQALELKVPETQDPPTKITHIINMKGGRRLNEDSLVFTEELRNWLKENGRKVKISSEGEGKWKLEIIKGDDQVTHKIKLRNIEWIDYEPSDGSFRQPVVPDLAEADASFDLEEKTEYKVSWFDRVRNYSERTNDCYGKDGTKKKMKKKEKKKSKKNKKIGKNKEEGKN